MIKTKHNYYLPQFGPTKWLHRKIYFYIPHIFMFCFELYWLQHIVFLSLLNRIFSLAKLSQVKNTNTKLFAAQIRWMFEINTSHQTMFNERSILVLWWLNVTWSDWNSIIPKYHTTKYEWIECLQLFLVCRNGVKFLSKQKLSSRSLYWHFRFESNLHCI